MQKVRKMYLTPLRVCCQIYNSEHTSRSLFCGQMRFLICDDFIELHVDNPKNRLTVDPLSLRPLSQEH